jgi:tRNA G18 (ribose-2'-O)-methylase SpoU
MPKNHIIVILEDIRSTHNVGSIFRSAEIFGVEQILIAGYTPAPSYKNDSRLPHIANKLNNQIAKTALGTEKLVKFKVFNNIKTAINEAKKAGYVIASIEQNSNSSPIDKFTTPPKIAIVLGNELTGVSDWTIKNSDVILEIQQYGKKESLNVANAAAIALYAISTK